VQKYIIRKRTRGIEEPRQEEAAFWCRTVTPGGKVQAHAGGQLQTADCRPSIGNGREATTRHFNFPFT
jgi:hypothetical protein